MDNLKDQVRKGFSNCKLDIEVLRTQNSQFKSEISTIYSENKNLKEDVKTLNDSIVQLKAELKGVTIALEYIKSFSLNNLQNPNVNSNQNMNPTLNPNLNLNSNQNINLRENSQQQNVQNNAMPQQQIPQQQTPPQQLQQKKKKRVTPQASFKDPYEALLAFKARNNKREVLKQKLLSMITENGIILSELKFLFVNHYRYCSKATFYNYLKEIEIEKLIRIERENSKNKVYLNKNNPNNIINHGNEI